MAYVAAMRTTLDLPEALLRQLKAQAALEGTSLKQLVLTLVERGLQSPAASPASLRSRSPLPTLARTCSRGTRHRRPTHADERWISA